MTVLLAQGLKYVWRCDPLVFSALMDLIMRLVFVGGEALLSVNYVEDGSEMFLILIIAFFSYACAWVAEYEQKE